jgi:hypothetical protein
MWEIIAGHAQGGQNTLKALRTTTKSAHTGVNEYHRKYKAARDAAMTKAFRSAVHRTVQPLVRA